MNKNKSCANCKHSKNVRIYEELKLWCCDEVPTSGRNFESETAFETFSCSLWVNVFKNERKNDL